MVRPKRTKYRKCQKGRVGGIDPRSDVHFGSYGLKALEPCRITERQIEACRVAITRKIKRIGKVWIRIFPDIPVSSKPTEVRMGKGKGAVDYWMCRVKAGKIMFEIDGVSMELAKRALELGASKLPVPTTFVMKKKYI
uniref:Ribosomal protein L16 n=2 Tax=Reclinomonas americana TaxID=48483 RepID=M4QCT1_RECAM|nr:ribosomal protein L16 [Reclinomonas americana ATCC 50633]AGH24339.1 ribosomal protein L16 [Reclinomonas americana ATCC 50283]